MKRIFYYVSAMLICASVFVSCEDDKKDDLKGGGSGRESGTFLPMDKQITAFNDAFIQTGDAVDFSDLGDATSIMIQSFACDSIDVMPAFATLQADELTAAKMKAVAGDEEWKNDFKALFSKYQEGSLDEDGALDVIFRFTPVDLDDIYFGVDLELVDTILNDNFLLKKVKVKRINHDVDRYVINIASSDHNFSLSFKLIRDEIERVVVTDQAGTDTAFAINLPKFIDAAVTVDGKNFFSYDAYTVTDFVLDGKLDRVNDKDTLTGLVLNGSYFQSECIAALGTNKFNALARYLGEEGITLRGRVSSGSDELFSANLGIMAELSPSMNLKNTVALGLWAMGAIKSVTADAKLGGDKICMVAGYDQNPVTALLTIAGSDQDNILEIVDTLNAHFTFDIYFKDYDEPQAKIKLAQKAPEKLIPVDDESFMNMILAGVANSGVYFAVETFDEDGYVITMPADKYFTQIDMNSFQELMTEKFNNMFAEVLAPLFGVDPDEFDLTDLIMGKADSYMARKGYK